MHDIWYRNLANLSVPIPALGVNDLFDLIFEPWSIKSTPPDPTKAIYPFAGHIQINRSGIVFQANYIVDGPKTEAQAIGVSQVPAGFVTVCQEKGVPDNSWNYVTIDPADLKIVYAPIAAIGGKARAIGHLHLKIAGDTMLERLLIYAVVRNPFWIPDYFKNIPARIGNVLPPIMPLESDLLRESSRHLLGISHEADGHEEEHHHDHGADHSEHSHGLLSAERILTGVTYEVPPGVTVMIATTNATGTAADPCIKFVGNWDAAGTTFEIQQIIVIPYAG